MQSYPQLGMMFAKYIIMVNLVKIIFLVIIIIFLSFSGYAQDTKNTFDLKLALENVLNNHKTILASKIDIKAA